MNILINNLLNEKDEKKNIRRATFWNMVASMLNAVTTAVLLLFVSRFCGIKQAGMFSIASAIAYQCLSLGNFGARNFHAADINYEYQFNDYFYQRIFSLALLLVMLSSFSFAQGYSFEKAMIVFSFGLYKAVDVIEDLFHGEYHRHGRLDIAAILLSIRYFISLCSFIILIIITHDLLKSSIIATIIALIVFIIGNKRIIRHYYHGNFHFSFNKFKALLIILIPIVISNSIKLYVSNSPKYAIDAVLGDLEQAYFNVLFMPVFVINLLSEAVFRPYIPKLSSSWNSHHNNDFIKLSFKQIMIILIVTIVVILGGYILGLKLLEIIYGVKLSKYMLTFIFLLAGGGVTTLCNFLMIILTIQREQNKMAIINIITFVICLLFAKDLVKHLYINGAALLFIGLNFILFTGYSLIALVALMKKKKSISH